MLERHRRKVLHVMGYTNERIASFHDGSPVKAWLNGDVERGGENWEAFAQALADAEAEGREERTSYREALHRIVDKLDRVLSEEFEPQRPTPLPFQSGLVGAINDVYSFHDAMDLPSRDEPSWPGVERAQLRLDLACEELLELAEALGVEEGWLFQARQYLDQMEVRHLKRASGDPLPEREQLTNIADALIDKIYIDVGTLLEFGIPGHRVWRVVHAANMAKQGGEKRADGKQLKPEGWKPPDVETAVFGSKEQEP